MRLSQGENSRRHIIPCLSESFIDSFPLFFFFGSLFCCIPSKHSTLIQSPAFGIQVSVLSLLGKIAQFPLFCLHRWFFCIVYVSISVLFSRKLWEISVLSWRVLCCAVFNFEQIIWLYAVLRCWVRLLLLFGLFLRYVLAHWRVYDPMWEFIDYSCLRDWNYG